jgi:hypothetical protein
MVKKWISDTEVSRRKKTIRFYCTEIKRVEADPYEIQLSGLFDFTSWGQSKLSELTEA